MEATHRVARITGELQDQIMKARMLPIDGVFQRMPRMVRDLAQKTGKEVDFVMEGGETELDRSVLEALGDPLIHLLRNSVDHGIEPPDVRVAAGKPAQGRVMLSARHEENHIVIALTDDGGGIDPVKIKAAAVKKGLLTQAAADAHERPGRACASSSRPASRPPPWSRTSPGAGSAWTSSSPTWRSWAGASWWTARWGRGAASRSTCR